MDVKGADKKASRPSGGNNDHFILDGPIDGTARGIKMPNWKQDKLPNCKLNEPSKILLNEVATLSNFSPTFGVEIEFLIVYKETNDPNFRAWGNVPEPPASASADWGRNPEVTEWIEPARESNLPTDENWDSYKTVDTMWDAKPAASETSYSTSTPNNNTWDAVSQTCDKCESTPTTEVTLWGFSTKEGAEDNLYDDDDRNACNDCNNNSVRNNNTFTATYVQKIVYDAIKEFSARTDEADVPIHDPSEPQFGKMDYTKWTVTGDHSVRLNDSEWKIAANKSQMSDSVELVSRVFRIDDGKWEGEIASVLAAVRSLNSDTVQVLVNESCGLHVHVGNGNEGIIPETQRKLSLLVTAFQRQIECLHSASRFNSKRAATDFLGDATFGEDCVFNAGPEEILRKQCYSVRKGLKMLLSRPSEDLPSIMSDNQSKHTTYNMSNRVKSTDSMTELSHELNAIRTIEFRQHRATLFFPEIQAWVMLVTRLVTYAANTPLDIVDYITDKQLGNRDFSMVQFLEELKMSDIVRNFYKRKCTIQSSIKEGEDVCEREQPQSSENPANPELMEHVNSEYVSSNSWEVVGAKVAVKMELGMYGLYLGELDEDLSQRADRGPNGTYKVPQWLRGVWKKGAITAED